MSDKPWRASNAKKMTFNEMAARAQYEWDRAEKAEAEAEHYEKECASLRTQLATAEARGRNEALEEAAKWHDEREAAIRSEQREETKRAGSYATGYSHAGVHNKAAKFIRSLSTNNSASLDITPPQTENN